MEVIKETTAAAIKIMTIGSVSSNKKRTIHGVFFPSANLFLPWVSKRFCASSVLNPLSEVCLLILLLHFANTLSFFSSLQKKFRYTFTIPEQ